MESRSPKIRLLAFLFGLLAVPLPYLGALLDSSAALLYRDLTNVQIPLKAEWVRAVHELGRIPFWDHFHMGGLPFLADPSYGPLYPLNAFFLLFRAEDSPRALLFFIVLHHLLLYAAGFLVARELRARPSLCALGGLLFAWCGFAMSSDNLVHILGAQLAMPLFFLLWRRSLRRGRPGPELALAAFALSWPLYAGDPQYIPLAVGACLLFIPFYPGKSANSLFSLLLLLTFFAAGPQLIPLLHHLGHGTRFAAASFDKQTVWSLHPARLLELFLPSPFVTMPGDSAAGVPSVVNGPHGGAFPFIFSYYTGAFSFAACGIFLLAKFRKKSRRRPVHAILAAAYLGMALLVLGSWSPLYSVFYRWLPLWNGFRYPERLGYWLVLPILAGTIYSLERLLRLRKIPPRIAGITGGAFVFFTAFAFFWALRYGPIFHGALIFAAALLLLLRRRPNREVLLFCLASVDLFLSAQRLVWPQSLESLSLANLPAATEILARQNPEDLSRGGPRRFLSLLEGGALNPSTGTPLLALDTAQAWLSLRANTAAYFGIENAAGHGSLTPERAFLREPCSNSACERRVAELLSVRTVLRGPRLEVFALESSLPFAFFPSRARVATDSQRAFDEARTADFDFHHTVTVESPIAGEFAPSEVISVHRGWDSILIRVRTGGAPSLLVVNEAFDPYWTAGTLAVKRINGWAMGVELMNAGEQEISFRYHDESYYQGALGFFVWLVALVGLFIRSRAGAGAATGPKQVSS